MARRTVLFLGAGASKPFGFPLTEGILAQIWAGLQGSRWRGWPGFKEQRDKLKLRRELRDLLLALLPGLKPTTTDISGASIVDVVSLVDQLIGEGRSPAPGFSSDQLLRGRALLQLGINAVLKGSSQLKLRNHLVEWILQEALRRPDSRLTVVSTNYDTLVEQRLYDRLVPLKTSIGQQVDFGIAWRDVQRDLVHTRPRRGRLAVFKLHGSLNWLRCETCGHISINVRQRIASLEFWRKLLQYNECQCGGRLRSVLVTPSVVRDVRDANLLSIWNAALEDLRRADEWILVGYSLPSEDIAIRSLLLRAYHARSKRASLRIRVVQWEPEDRPQEDRAPAKAKRAIEYRRYRLFFPTAHLDDDDYERGGTEEFVRALKVSPRGVATSRLRRAFPRADWLH